MQVITHSDGGSTSLDISLRISSLSKHSVLLCPSATSTSTREHRDPHRSQNEATRDIMNVFRVWNSDLSSPSVERRINPESAERVHRERFCKDSFTDCATAPVTQRARAHTHRGLHTVTYTATVNRQPMAVTRKCVFIWSSSSIYLHKLPESAQADDKRFFGEIRSHVTWQKLRLITRHAAGTFHIKSYWNKTSMWKC